MKKRKAQKRIRKKEGRMDNKGKRSWKFRNYLVDSFDLDISNGEVQSNSDIPENLIISGAIFGEEDNKERLSRLGGHSTLKTFFVPQVLVQDRLSRSGHGAFSQDNGEYLNVSKRGGR